jgi:hypothetical protein
MVDPAALPFDAPSGDTVSQIVTMIALLGWGWRRVGAAVAQVAAMLGKGLTFFDKAGAALADIQAAVHAARADAQALLAAIRQVEARHDAALSSHALRIDALERVAGATGPYPAVPVERPRGH